MKKLVALMVIFCITISFAKKEITWVAIGDSITYLNDHVNGEDYEKILIKVQNLQIVLIKQFYFYK